MTHKMEWFQELAGEIGQGLYALYAAEFQKYIEGLENFEQLDGSFTQVAYALAPNPISPQDYEVRGPYGNPKYMAEQMKRAVERGWLKEMDGGFTISAEGKEAVEGMLKILFDAFAAAPAMVDEKMGRLYDLLKKLVKQAKELEEPAEKLNMDWGKAFQKAFSADIPLIHVRRRMTDLNAFRDDSHLAAWLPSGVSGNVWETLTFLWREEAHTAAQLVEKLPFRNYDEVAYQAALEELAAKGWVKANDEGHYLVTAKGKEVRQKAEDVTDDYFYAAFDVLTDEEAAELKALMKKLAEKVKPPEEPEAETE